MKKKEGNPVAKYMRKYNKATVQTDRKKDAKRGYAKHKGQYDEAKVECPKCDGAGCKHCDEKGYHTKNEEVETNSAAKKAIFVTNPTTGKRETKMEPTHRKKLDKMHKDHDDMHEGVEECWDTHQKVGTKIKDGKVVNDCRPKSEGLALPGYPEQEKLKIVDPFKKVAVKEEIEEVDEFLRVKTNPAFSARTTSSGDRKSNNKQKTSSQSISTTSGNGYKVSRNIKTGQTTKSRTNVGGRTSQKESTIKISEATSQKLLNKMKELSPKGLPRTSVELRKLKAKAQEELRGARAAKRNAPKPKVTSKTAKGNIRTGNKGSDERNIIMQLRKAQDLDGKFDISVSPKQGRTVRIGKNQIDALLRNYNKLQKPDQKRAFVIQVTRALRQKSK